MTSNFCGSQTISRPKPFGQQFAGLLGSDILKMGVHSVFVLLRSMALLEVLAGIWTVMVLKGDFSQLLCWSTFRGTTPCAFSRLSDGEDLKHVCHVQTYCHFLFSVWLDYTPCGVATHLPQRL